MILEKFVYENGCGSIRRFLFYFYRKGRRLEYNIRVWEFGEVKWFSLWIIGVKKGVLG